jgi:hypothetical protein
MHDADHPIACHLTCVLPSHTTACNCAFGSPAFYFSLVTMIGQQVIVVTCS